MGRSVPVVSTESPADASESVARRELRAESAVWGTYAAGGIPAEVAYTSDRRYVATGRKALLVTSSRARDFVQRKFVWQEPGLPVRPQQRYRISATVSAQAAQRGHVILGVRRQTGEISQNGAISPQQASRLTGNALRRTLSVVFVVPPGVSSIQIALWQEVRPQQAARFSVDDVSIMRAGPIGPPDVTRTPARRQPSLVQRTLVS